jgi:hypothetical protein
MWGNFITQSNPSISLELANGASSHNTTAENPATDWPPYSILAPYQLNLNESGGTPIEIPVTEDVNITESIGPGLRNDFSLVNAYTWEGGRGFRCDFWKMMGVLVPE